MAETEHVNVKIRSYEPEDQEVVVALWEQCGLIRPWNDPRKDIKRKQKAQPELFLVAVEEDRVVATIMVGYEGHRGWVNYLAVDPNCRRRGFGRKLMAEAEERLVQLGCPKVNLQVRNDNDQAMAFYEGIGYLRDDVVTFGRRLERDD